MKIHLRTAHGDSNHRAPSDPDHPFQGMLQGSGAGPAVWLAISAFLVMPLHQASKTTTLRTPITNVTKTFIGLIFAGNADLIALGKPREDDTSTLHCLQN